MCLDGGMDVSSDFDSGTEFDTGLDSSESLDISAIDATTDSFDSSTTDAVSDINCDSFVTNDDITAESVDFDTEPLADSDSSDFIGEDIGESAVGQDSIESFEESADLSPIEDPSVNQEFMEEIGEGTVESELSDDLIESNDSQEVLQIADSNEDTTEEVSDSEIDEQSENWIPDDLSFENADGEQTEIKMDSDFLEERYAEAIENGDQDMADRYRALHDIVSISKDLELTDGDPEVTQLGGLHKKVQGQIDGFESHHIPAKSVQDVNPRDLPTIALSKEDHALTDSYRWKSNREYEPFLPDGLDEHPTYKQEAEEMIDSGKYTDLVRDELYNIRDTSGHKYDGAIKQYLNELSSMIAKDGIPNKKTNQ